MTTRPGGLRHLAALLAPGGGRADFPAPGDQLGWDRLLATAAQHRLLPALWPAARAARALEEVPEPLRLAMADRLPPGRQLPAVVLADAHRANASRVADLLDQARSVLAHLNTTGIPAVPLKGVDALLVGRFHDPAVRTITDIDLLVHPSRASDAWASLRDLGYEPVDAPPAEHHLPPLVRPGRAGSVEVHSGVLRGRWRDLLGADGLLARARSADGAGLRLHRDDAVAVLVAHAHLQDEGRLLFDVPLRALHETAVLLGGGEPVDWSAVAARLHAGGAGSVVAGHLELTTRLFGGTSPVAAPPRARLLARTGTTLADHERIRALLGQVAFTSRSFSSERMTALHGGPAAGMGLWRTRVRHALAGARRRRASGS